jgi:hypothetical protein
MNSGLEKLIDVDDWSLARLYGEGVGISHTKCNSWMHQSAYNRECLDCRVRIPDEIYGLWLLYNFDKLGGLLP